MAKKNLTNRNEAEFIKYWLYRSELNLSTRNATKLYHTLIEMIIEELSRNGEIKLERLGTFTAVEVGGRDFERTYNGIKRKISRIRKKRIGFKPEPNLENVVNGEIVNTQHQSRMKRKLTKKTYTKQEAALINNGFDDTLTVEELLMEQINNKERQKKVAYKKRKENKS